MTKLSISSLTPLPPPKSKASQLAELLPEIEAALAAGHTHRAIYEDVKRTTGIDLKFGYYENIIHRLRARKIESTQTQTKDATEQERRLLPSEKTPVVPARINRPAVGSQLQDILHGPVDDFFS
jgi:hypothetical protein